MTTYKAAYTTESTERGEIRLTSEADAACSDEHLMAIALEEAAREGLEITEADITVGDWTE